MNQYVKLALGVVIVGLVGYAFGRYVQPANVKIEKQEVVKEVEVVKRDVVTVEREVTRPDGTVEKERRTEDRTTETLDRSKENREKTVVDGKPQWRVQGLAGLKLGEAGVIYGAGVERRIIGPIFAGAYGKTDREVGISVSIEF